jgi:hypothetical protein
MKGPWQRKSPKCCGLYPTGRENETKQNNSQQETPNFPGLRTGGPGTRKLLFLRESSEVWARQGCGWGIRVISIEEAEDALDFHHEGKDTEFFLFMQIYSENHNFSRFQPTGIL